jgi:hypothetical protein
MSCPLHGPNASCDCRYVVEGLLLTGLVCAGVVWLVGERVWWRVKSALP